jgi:phosphoglycerate dehydrogenase-like enzyme
MTEQKPLVLFHPAPKRLERVFDADTWQLFQEEFEVVSFEKNPDEKLFDQLLPNAFAIVGQPDLPTERLRAATKLKALMNVEGGFFQNVDYPTAFQQGVRVLGCGPAYAEAVAEISLGFALDLARGISREDRAFRKGTEVYLGKTDDAVLLKHSTVGFIGFGNIGRALHRLLAPFRVEIRAFDPWLPDATLEENGIIPATLEETLKSSQFVFVLATATQGSRHLLSKRELSLLPDGARLMVVSRASVVDFDALMNQVEDGRIMASIDVWPTEPVPVDHRARNLEGLVLSPHRAGGIPQAYLSIGKMVLDDLRLIRRGLPPVRMQIAAPEIVGEYQNMPAKLVAR